MEWHGMGWHGITWNAMGWHGMVFDGIGYGMGWHGMGRGVSTILCFNSLPLNNNFFDNFSSRFPSECLLVKI